MACISLGVVTSGPLRSARSRSLLRRCLIIRGVERAFGRIKRLRSSCCGLAWRKPLDYGYKCCRRASRRGLLFFRASTRANCSGGCGGSGGTTSSTLCCLHGRFHPKLLHLAWSVAVFVAAVRLGICRLAAVALSLRYSRSLGGLPLRHNIAELLSRSISLWDPRGLLDPSPLDKQNYRAFLKVLGFDLLGNSLSRRYRDAAHPIGTGTARWRPASWRQGGKCTRGSLYAPDRRAAVDLAQPAVDGGSRSSSALPSALLLEQTPSRRRVEGQAGT